MPPVPPSNGREVLKVFQSHGSRFVRQIGSHPMMAKAGQTATLAIPNHNEVAKGTLRGLIRTANLTVDEFLAAI